MVPFVGAGPVTDKQLQRGGSSAVQGCLFGAVALFVFLLVVLIFLAYGQFRTNTEPGAGPGTPVSMLEQMDRGAA